MLAKLLRHRPRHAGDGVLRQIVEKIPQVRKRLKIRGRAHDQPAAPGQHQRHSQPSGCEVGADAGREHSIPQVEGLLPEGYEGKRPALAVLVASPHVVDEEVETPMIVPDAVEERYDVRINGVVALHGDSAAAADRHFVGSLVNRAGHVVRGRSAVDASAGHINRGSGNAELDGDAAAGTPTRTRNQSDDVIHLCHELSPIGESELRFHNIYTNILLILTRREGVSYHELLTYSTISMLKVGDLARRTGLTIRTLHHYEEMGVLVPDGRTSSGHRLYSGYKARRQELGEDGIRKGESDWQSLIDAVRTEMNRGTDPDDPRVKALALRWQKLIEAFTGGDPGILQSLGKMYEEEGPERAGRGAVDSEIMSYIQKAMQER